MSNKPIFMTIIQSLVIQNNQKSILLIKHNNTWNFPFSSIQTHENWYTNIKRTIKKQLGLSEIEMLSVFDVQITNHKNAIAPCSEKFLQ